jgi:hypothetical protein
MSGDANIKEQPVRGASAPARAATTGGANPAAARGAAELKHPTRSTAASTAPSVRAKLARPRKREPTASLTVAPGHCTNELVFVDSSTPRYESLIEDMRAAAAEGRRVEFVLIDAWRDGVHKITETLVQKKDLDAIHIVSHARDGAVRLGSAQLDFDTLQKRTVQITAWCDALHADGDILLYGCDPAASEEGQALLEELVRLTGAQAAAGEEPPGVAAKGEDWRLEFKPGAVEAPVVSGHGTGDQDAMDDR